MKIIIEANIPYIKGILEPIANVEYLHADKIDKDAVHDADILLVRTRTQCNKTLLEGSRCCFIGTATIGIDHIDTQYCTEHHIDFFNAPGCNAPAVAQYVISSIGHWMNSRGVAINMIHSTTLGIVGVGHVGSIVARWARDIGFKVLLNDPPRQRQSGSNEFVSLDTIKDEADIITFHTPLTSDGIDKTYHLCDNDFINSLNHCSLIINSARGSIVDNHALAEALKAQKLKDAVIDCWEDEPEINHNLLNTAFIATPHIAGYSIEGKMRATSMILQSLKEYFNLNIDVPTASTSVCGSDNATMQKVMDSYNPIKDTNNLKSYPQKFEDIRNTYNLRHEVE